jgi:acetyl esterase/lipase
MLIAGQQIDRVFPKLSDVGERLGRKTAIEEGCSPVHVLQIEGVVEHVADHDTRHTVVVARSQECCQDSFVLTADISAFVAKYWFPGLPWDNVEHYEKRSLLSVVKNVKTPTMVITGEEDYRTPISESEQYFQALKLLNVESVLVRVPGEPHGIARRPSHHMFKVLNIVGWFDKHKAKP